MRDACDGEQFAGYKTVSEIANAVGEIEEVKATQSKFAECPI